MAEARDAHAAAENLRERIQDYLDDAAQAKREAERLQAELAELKRRR
jgi:succinate dehydrogenase/fumarate reductase flavoprotein subunit